jgi:hypothetical protein
MIILPEMIVYKMNHKKKQYTIEPIEKITSEEEATEAGYGGNVEGEKDQESEINFIRSEFSVEDTGESKSINEFPSKKYMVNWVTEWENVQTGERGTDRLTTAVWTTPIAGEIQKARDEEMTFTKAYMESLGIDTDSLQQMILGTSWLAILGSMGESRQQTRHKGSNFSDEMKKIEGYPVVIDGKYFAKREGGESEEDGSKDSGGGVKGMLGGLANKALKKKSKNDNEPAFTYYTELLEFSPAKVGDDAFQVPSNYKKKG